MAKLKIAATIAYRERSLLRWRETTMSHETFHFEETQGDSMIVMPIFLDRVWAFMCQKHDGGDVDLKLNYKLENTGAPVPSAGSIVQSKHQFDIVYTFDDVGTRENLTSLVTGIADALYAARQDV